MRISGAFAGSIAASERDEKRRRVCEQLDNEDDLVQARVGRYPELDGNTSICEQEGRLRSRFTHITRQANEETFNLLLFMICDARQRFYIDLRRSAGQSRAEVDEDG